MLGGYVPNTKTGHKLNSAMLANVGLALLYSENLAEMNPRARVSLSTKHNSVVIPL